MSTYIFDRAPHRYGDQQQAFVDVSNAIVNNATDSFRNAIAKSQDLIQLFFSTLDSFAASRHDIAVSHKTVYAERFGIRRDGKEGYRLFAITPLSGPFSEYNNHLLAVIQKQLKTMEYFKNNFKQTKSQVYFDPCLERDSVMDYSILTRETKNWEQFSCSSVMDYSILTGEIKNWEQFSFSQEDVQRIYELSEVIPTGHSIDPLLHNKEAMQKLKEKSPNDYLRLKLLGAIPMLRKNYPEDKKSIWIHIAVRFSLNGKMQDLSEYLTWAYRDFVEDRVDAMTFESVFAILHQDPFLIETMLDDMAKIFKNIIEWNGQNLKNLKDQVALFRYEHSHAMPFRRGSAAVAEWFERALYGAHGFKVAYNPDKMVDLEALTSSLKEFVDNYDSMITLTKIEEKASEPKVEL